MRLSVIMSMIMHLAFIGLVYLALPDGWTPKLRYSPPVPIEILREAELAEILSVPEMAPEQEPDEQQAPPETSETQAPTPQTDGPITSSEASASSEVKEPEVENIPEPLKPPETEPEPVIADEPEQQPEPAEPPTITPPTPQPQNQGDLDFSALGQAASNIGGSQGGTPENATPSAIPGFSQKRIGEGSKLTASDEAIFKAAMARCWNVNIGAPNPERLKVQISFMLKRDGSLVGPPEVKNERQINRSGDQHWQAAKQAAVRAVLDCAPYDLLPVERYETWQIVELNFDPSEMVGIR
jgi:hypothetical protein